MSPLVRTVSVLVLVAALVTGCATLTPPDRQMLVEPIRSAAETSPETLRTQAEAGDPQAQIALSLAHKFGLNGLVRNESEAQVWRRRALAARGSSPVLQYVPAFDGQPARTHIVNVPQGGVSPVQVAVVEQCATALEDAASSGQAACGGSQMTAHLQMLWRIARRRD